MRVAGSVLLATASTIGNIANGKSCLLQCANYDLFDLGLPMIVEIGEEF